MPEAEVKKVSRIAIYQPDEKGRIHQLLVQRPEDSKREANQLSMIGGTNNFDLPANETTLDPDLYQAVAHIENELGIKVEPDQLQVVDRLTSLEDTTGIQWQEVCYLLKLAEEPLPTFVDQQPHHGVARPIEWFEVEITDTDGLLFHADGKTAQPLRPTDNHETTGTYDKNDIAFKQYIMLVVATSLALSEE